MGAVPKRKISTSRKGKRRSAIKLSLSNLAPCPNCQQPKPPHQACPHCHYYQGRSTVVKKEKKTKKEPKTTRSKKT